MTFTLVSHQRPVRLAVLLILLAFALVGMVAVAQPAWAHGCTHSDHYELHNGHYDYWDYNGHDNINGAHIHFWYNGSHAYYEESFCGCVSYPCSNGPLEARGPRSHL